MHGYSTGQIAFPSWLGNFSKQAKYNRLLKELNVRMRLTISGTKNDLRQSYMPTLARMLAKPLVDKAKVSFFVAMLTVGRSTDCD